MVDKAGHRVVTDASEIYFENQGLARMIGIGNGNLSDAESNQDLVHHVYQGRGMAIVQSEYVSWVVQIEASSEGPEPANVRLTVR